MMRTTLAILRHLRRLRHLRHVLHGALVLAAPLAAPFGALAAEPAAPKGSLVIIGGNLRADNADVWGRIVQLAGGKGARIAVLPSASADPARSGEAIVGWLNGYGADAFLVP